MTKSITVWAVVFGLLVAVGCDPGQQLEGKFEGFRDMNQSKQPDPAIRKTLSRVRLEITGSRFVVEDGGLVLRGDVGREGDHWVLRPQSALDRPVAKGTPDIVVQKAEGGWTYDNPASVSPGTVILKRNETLPSKRQ